MICFIIVFLAALEYIAFGIAILDKKSGNRLWFLDFIPFVAFFRADRLSGGFDVATVHVRKLGVTFVIFAVVITLATVYAQWGRNNLPDIDSDSLTQIMYIPAVVCLVVAYVDIVGFAVKMIALKRRRFRFDVLACMLFLTIPFLINMKEGNIGVVTAEG